MLANRKEIGLRFVLSCMVEYVEKKIGQTARLIVATISMATTLMFVAAMLDSVNVILSPWWYWASLVCGFGAGVNIYMLWSRDRSFRQVVFLRLVGITAVHMFASVVVKIWLSVPTVPDSAAFIASVSYAPVFYLSIRSYKKQ